MEVHAHTHSQRKKWTHYFWEFLMLFLAVFCGFLAEYQLEHKIEKEKGKQYIRSFVEDLETDTSIFSGLIGQYREKTTKLGTFVECYRGIISGEHSDSCLLQLFFNSSFFPDLIYTDRTLQQLKNAGGLRMIPPVDADSIIEYDKLLRLYQKQETTAFQEIQTTIRNSIYELNNFGQAVSQFSPGKHVILFSNNRELLNKYFNKLYFYLHQSQSNTHDLEILQSKAKSLIFYFGNKYHFK